MTDQAAEQQGVRTDGKPDGLVNVRDLGGLPTDDESQTRSGVIYRSDAPHAGDAAPVGLPVWPPATVVDLRDTVDEIDGMHPLEQQSTIVRIPLLEGVRSAEGPDLSLSLAELYRHILDHAPQRLLEIFRVALASEGPVLVHCAAGKDRTGVVSALLARVAGVRFDAIVADYVHTDRNMPRVLQRLDVAPVLPPGVDEEAVRELISAPAGAIEAVLTHLDSADGGAAGWLRSHGATDSEISTWQKRFLEAITE